MSTENDGAEEEDMGYILVYFFQDSTQNPNPDAYENEMLVDSFNLMSINMPEFYCHMKMLAEENELEIEEYLENGVVIEGTLDDLDAIAIATDEKYTYSFLYDKELKSLLKAENEAPTMRLNS